MTRTFLRLLSAVAVLATTAATAHAQWHSTAIGVAEYDTESTLLLLGGLSATPGGMGLAPLIGVQAYYLTYEAAGRVNVWTAKPYAGLANNYNGGSLYGSLGYAFSNSESGVPLGASTDVGEGVVLAGGWDHWGTGSPLGYQALASYNFGSESFWGRGRVTSRIGSRPVGQHRFGGEVAYLDGTGYSIVQPGAIYEIHNGRGQILGLGAGVKIPNAGDNAFYVKVEGVLPLGGR